MATLLTKNYFSLRMKRGFQQQQFNGVYKWYNSIMWKRGKRILTNGLGVLVSVSATCGTILYFLDRSVQAMRKGAPPPSYPWDTEGWTLKTLDYSAVRRGWQVYRTVCATCHSLSYVRFMDLINVTHTRDEVKDIAAEYEIEDGPDEEGNYFMRPGRLSDLFPSPYPNEKAARAANFGAYPPDLSYIILARRNSKNYVFSLLTGWMDPPAGVSLAENQYFNSYFPGYVISMAPMLIEGMMDYDDGTPSSVSQMAKDLVEFLSWTSSQSFDERKRMFIKAMGVCTILLASAIHYSRYVWSFLKSRQIAYVPKRKY